MLVMSDVLLKDVDVVMVDDEGTDLNVVEEVG